ncbi:MAG: DUF488 family protein [Solirubrobacteraceae bacterium]
MTVPPRIFTVGHSTHELPGLVELLHAHGIGTVADVRAHPGSRRMPWFNREALAGELAAAGIDYSHLPALGGRRRPAPDSPNRGWEVEAFRGYADHMASGEFAGGLERLEATARQRPTAILCAEGLWWRCHRRLVADALLVRGWEVLHIAPDAGAAAHELTPFAAVDGTRVTYPPAQASLPAD